MALSRFGAGPRFFVTLAVVVLALAGSVVVGLRGMSEVNTANRAMFSDNLQTAEATSHLVSELGRAEVVSLQITDAQSDRVSDRLRAHLEEVVIPDVRSDIAAMVTIHDRDAADEKAQIARIPVLWDRFVALAHDRLLDSDTLAQEPATAIDVDNLLDPLIAFVTVRQPREVADAAGAHSAAARTYDRSRTWMLIVAGLALLAAVSMIQAGRTLRQLLGTQTHDRGFAESSSEYTGRLQSTEDEDEAHELLRRQLERTHEGSHAVVLSRNNSADRLEPRTPLTDLPALKPALEHAEPRSCMAIRFATSHIQGDDRQPLTSCEVCGQLPGTSNCEPLLVGGEVIGSVLVSQPATAAKADPLMIRQTVSQAAPVLGNLRNLALAHLRAATDTLTGLPNQRSVQDTLKRMVAQASRTITPLAAVLVDLDHFKQINDLYGHDRGDEVLAAVGIAFRNAVRESDFVGRYGGEEFLILLPSTGKEGAAQVAEAVRTAIAAIRITGIDRPITASCGVAALPEDAGDAVTLFRAADRALYGAKHAGRDRVHIADATSVEPADVA
jgi:diguanylate cyclase (GGDEF)-like protein